MKRKQIKFYLITEKLLSAKHYRNQMGSIIKLMLLFDLENLLKKCLVCVRERKDTHITKSAEKCELR